MNQPGAEINEKGDHFSVGFNLAASSYLKADADIVELKNCMHVFSILVMFSHMLRWSINIQF